MVDLVQKCNCIIIMVCILHLKKLITKNGNIFLIFFSHGGGGRCCVVFSYGYMYTGTEWPLQLFFVWFSQNYRMIVSILYYGQLGFFSFSIFLLLFHIVLHQFYMGLTEDVSIKVCAKKAHKPIQLRKIPQF